MSIDARTPARSAGLNWGKLERLRRDAAACAARLRGSSEHRAATVAHRSELRSFLIGDDAAMWILAKELPDLDRAEPELALAMASPSLLKKCGIDPDDVADCLALNDEIAALTREIAAAHVDLDQRSALLARLMEYAHHAP